MKPLLIRMIFILPLTALTISCAGDKGDGGATASQPANVIEGTLTGPDGPLRRAEIRLKTYRDEDCVKLAQSKAPLSQEEKMQLEECSRELTTATSDEEGRYVFPNVSEGWYGLVVNWTSDAKPSIPGPLFIYREGDFLITLIWNKDKPLTGTAVGEIFRLSGGQTGRKDLMLKKL